MEVVADVTRAGEKPIAGDKFKTCIECRGKMSPVIIMDKNLLGTQQVEFHLPDDRPDFWGHYPTAGRVGAYMCRKCGRISTYGDPSRVKLVDSPDEPGE